MNLRGITGRGKAGTPVEDEHEISSIERTLTLLVEGTALNMPQIDADSYKAFRANVSRLALQIPDRLPEEDKLALLRTILHEYEVYRDAAETALRERTAGWRGLVILLYRDLLASLGAGANSPEAAALGREIPTLASADDLREWRTRVEEFLHPPDAEGQAQGLASLKTADRSTENDNAAGLRGGGSAVEQLKRIMEGRGSGFIALFRLSCLEVINQRFGKEAVEDCLMAVSAFLTASLHSDDQIYHWSDSSLLAILLGRPSEQILAAELQRIASQNRETSINVAGRAIMLRIPLAFELTPINRLRTAEDLYRLSTKSTTKW
ncbi:MAG TPA: diguanylate cyclase [Terracidiphilus sp.]|nr:diguanylate cyclase [Terracidiphilus sp.]